MEQSIANPTTNAQEAIQNVQEGAAATTVDANTAILEDIKKQQIKQTRMSRVRMIMSIICAIAFVIVALTLLGVATVTEDAIKDVKAALPQVIEAVDDVKAKVDAIDVDNINATVTEVKEKTEALDVDSINSAAANAADALAKISAIDYDGINSAISKLDGAVEGIASVDFNQLNEAIKTLTATLTPLATFFGIFNGSSSSSSGTTGTTGAAQ